MAIGSGLGAQFGFATESTYGTYATVDHFIPSRSYTVDKTETRVQGEGIAAGKFGPLGSHHIPTVNGGSGRVEFDVQQNKLGPLWQTLMGGSVVTPSNLAGTAYEATFPLGDPYGHSLSVQLGAPYRTGTVRPHTITGAKVISAEFNCDVAGLLTASATFDAKTFTTGQSLATASYATSGLFHGGQLTVSMGTYGTESSISGVRSVSVSIERGQDTSDYTAGSSGQKSEPVLNAYTTISGSITADWLDTAVFQDRAHDATAQPSLVLSWVGDVITSSHYETFQITVPGVVFTPATQGVGGVQELTNTWNWTWVYDGTNLPSIYTISTDSAL